MERAQLTKSVSILHRSPDDPTRAQLPDWWHQFNRNAMLWREQKMSKMMTVSEIVKENEQAMKRAGKRARRSKETARAFLVRAGILDKSGKRLAKPYR